MKCSLLSRFVGGWGIGPKYLVDEYAVLDTRYWVLGDSMVAWVCYQEFFIMMPLELIWYVALQKKHWSRHYWAVITGEHAVVAIVDDDYKSVFIRDFPTDGHCVLHWCGGK